MEHNGKSIDEHYPEIISEFNNINLELKKVESCLTLKYEMNFPFTLKKWGVYKIFKNLMSCFNVLVDLSETDSVVSLITLGRLIADYYAVLYLFVDHSEKKIQKLRYFLYLLDTLEVEQDLTKLFFSNRNVSFKKQADEKIEQQKKNIDLLMSEIEKHSLKGLVIDKIIKKRNWKFRDQKNNAKFSWAQLYRISGIPERHAEKMQKYNSQFCHGLGMQLMLGNEQYNLLNKCDVLENSRFIQGLILILLLKEFQEDTQHLEFHDGTIELMEFLKKNWK